MRKVSELQYATDLFERIFDALPATAILVDRDGVIVAVNEPWKRFEFANILIEPNVLVGKNYLDLCRNSRLLGELEASRVCNEVTDILCGSLDSYEAEYACHSPEGKRWCRIFVRSLIQKDARFAVIFHFDITETKFAEFSLKRQNKILNLVHDAIIVVDMHDIITYVNKSAIELYGWSKSEFIGKSASDLDYGSTSTDFEKKRRALFETGGWAGEVIHVNRLGQKLTIGAQWSLIRNEFGEDAILKVHTDMSLLGQLLRAQRLQTIGNIAGGVAHDLNNILTPLMLLADSIQSDKTSNHVEAAQKISSLTERASGLLRQLLGFSRGFEGEREVANVYKLIDEACSLVKLSLPDGIRLSIETNSQEIPIVCNQTQIHQVLMNLCLNSRDAIGASGAVAISISKKKIVYGYKPFVGEANPGNYVCISVADTGSGISAIDLEHIFEPFFSSKPIGQGTGLGLSTCLGIVKSHGGFIDVKSELERGAIFSVYLPLFEGDTVASNKVQVRNLNSGSVQIMIVDDEEEIRNFLKSLLSANGFNVVSAKTGEEAVAIIVNSSFQFDLIVSDMKMPGMSGTELIEYLSEFQPETRIIAMSGLEVDQNQLEQLKKKSVAFLQKPFRSNKILSAIENALNVNQVS